ncbi:hypothetical protein GOODEAATRI_020696, partial [Goodea atripinnis]
LADLGHSVVGVEISEMAIRQFFQENNMTYSEESLPSLPGATLFQVSLPPSFRILRNTSVVCEWFCLPCSSVAGENRADTFSDSVAVLSSYQQRDALSVGEESKQPHLRFYTDRYMAPLKK